MRYSIEGSDCKTMDGCIGSWLRQRRYGWLVFLELAPPVCGFKGTPKGKPTVFAWGGVFGLLEKTHHGSWNISGRPENVCRVQGKAGCKEADVQSRRSKPGCKFSKRASANPENPTCFNQKVQVQRSNYPIDTKYSDLAFSGLNGNPTPKLTKKST